MRLYKYALIPRYIHWIDSRVGIKQMILQQRMSGLDEMMVQNLEYAIFASEAQGKELALDKIRHDLEQNTRADIEEYLPILFNQALVMMCAVFDVFLVDSLNAIIRKDPKMLHQLTSDKDISISEVINSSDYDEIFEIMRKKVSKRFNFGGIKDKIVILKKIGLDMDGIFNFKFHNDNPRKKFPEAQKKLISIYDDRHGIVHEDTLTIQTPEDLEPIGEFFSDLIVSFAWEMGQHFDIPTDFDLLQTK